MALSSPLWPDVHTRLPGPRAAILVSAGRTLISPSYTRSYPFVARRGAGMYVDDVDGNRFLGFTAGIAVCSTGHCHLAVVEAIQRQAVELIHRSGADFYQEPLVRAAQRLSATAPMPGPHRFFFGNSGTEAVEDWPSGAHAFGGNPLALAAAEATLGLLGGGPIRNTVEAGRSLMQRLQGWPAQHPMVGEVRGLGLMIGSEIVHPSPGSQPGRSDAATRDAIVRAAFARGLWLLGCGACSIRLMPPLICERAHADIAWEVLEACVEKGASDAALRPAV